jgi:hypothetical protein
MKKILSTIVLAILSGIVASAQQAVVTGTVLDSLSREGEPSAILQFFKAPDLEKPVAFTTTDNDGKFAQTLTGKGDYRLLFSNMGRKTLTRDFTLDGTVSTIDLGTILVQDDVQTLKAGTVTAQRPLVKMDVDKMTYDVANDVDSKTSTVLDMLRKVPMVSVDGQDNITVNGSSSFQVYVDGKPNQMISSNPSVVFKMMPASAVKDISVVTNPGVRYDAEGVGGVLQITTNREVTGGVSAAEGAYGTITAQASTRGGGAGIFYSQQKGKFAMSLTGNAMLNNSPGTTIDVERSTTAGMTTSMHSEGTMKNPIALGNLNISYEIDSLNLISATGGLMGLGSTSDNTGLTTLGFGGTGFSYTTDTWSKGNTASITASADYQHLWAGRPNRSFVLSYLFSASPSTTDSKNLFGNTGITMLDLTDRRTDGKTNSIDHTVQADFTTPVDGIGTLSTGVKYISRHNLSDQMNYLWNGSGWDFNEPGSTNYDYYNRIGAAYTEMSVNFGLIGIKAGARYEHTWQNYSQDGGKAFRTDYGCLVPSATLQLNLGMTSNIGLSYNMRISRPGITYLNPYRDDSDPTALNYGNPDLEVEKAHNVNLVYNYFTTKFMLNLTARYGFTGNGISPYSFYQDNVLHSTYGNIIESTTAGLNAFVMVNAGAKTRIILNGGVDYSDLRSDVLGQQNSGWSGNGLLGFQQTLPWDLRFSANAILMSRTKDLQGWSTGISLGTLGLTKTFLDDRLSASLSIISPLGSGSLAIKSHSETREFTSDMSIAVPIRQASLSISWTFGKQGNFGVKKARKTITNDDVINTQSTAETLNGSGALGGTGTSSTLPTGM